jgi:hypothetical protein
MTKNDRRLCRHKNNIAFKKSGFGWIKQDYGRTCKVEWVNSRKENLMMKSYLIIFDNGEINEIN